jgi:hypothetical protein
MKRMMEAKEAATSELMDKKNVVGVGVGNKYTDGSKTGELAIVVYVSQKGGRLAAADRIPDEIDGIPTDVIEADFEPKEKKALNDLTPSVDTGTYDPLQGGISIGPCRAIDGFVFTGTLGCIVTDNVTGDKMLLTNHHVAAIDTDWAVGDTQCQPSRVDTGSCPTDVVGTLQRAVIDSSIDGAVISHDARNIDCTIVDIGEVEGTATVAVGDRVRKRGRTTELTVGEVDAVGVSVTVPYDPSIGSVTLNNQIIIGADTTTNPAFGLGGDSGSVVVNDDNEVVGLYFAGNSAGDIGVANPIAAVEAGLDVTVYTCPSKGLKELKDKDFKELKDKDFKDIKEKDLKDIKEKDFKDGKEIKEDLKEFKDGKEFKEDKEAKEKEKEKEGKEFKDGKEVKEGLKEFKEDLKEFKEKEDIKDLKEKEFKDGKEKDIVEGPGGRLPFDPPRRFGSGAEERLARLEQAVAGLQHFISSSLRPELSGSPLARETDVDQERVADLQRELYGRAQAAQAAKDAADTPGRF